MAQLEARVSYTLTLTSGEYSSLTAALRRLIVTANISEDDRADARQLEQHLSSLRVSTEAQVAKNFTKLATNVARAQHADS